MWLSDIDALAFLAALIVGAIPSLLILWRIRDEEMDWFSACLLALMPIVLLWCFFTVLFWTIFSIVWE